MLEKKEKRYKRHKRVRAKIFGTAQSPRLCVFRSGKHIYAQLIDDEKGRTILSASDRELEGKKINKFDSAASTAKIGKKDKEEKTEIRKTAIAREVGKLIAKKSVENKFEKVVFDRGGYKYYGRVKALAEGAREGGLKF